MSLLRSGTQVAILTFISRIFGLSRELFIAQAFGTGAIADSLNVAFKLPNLFRRIFAEGALSNVFIPIFNNKLLESNSKAKYFSGEIFTLLLITLVILVGIIEILMPYLMLIIAPGFYLDEEKFTLTVLLCRITMPYLIFISITAFFGGILNSLSRYVAFAFTPIILSVVIIFATIINSHTIIDSAINVSSAWLIAGVLQVGFMFFCLKRTKFTFSIVLNPKDPDVKILLKNMLPATISAGTIQLNLFISQTLASFLPGAVSILAYADRIYQFPLSIIGISFGTILLPELSRIYKSSDHLVSNQLQNKAIKLAILISLPAAAGIWLLSHPIIHVLYERGAFDAAATTKTAATISAFALGLPAFILTKIFIPIFYAKGDPHTPLKITIYSMIINIVLNICLMPFFQHVGIALGSSVAGWINLWLLYYYARKQTGFTINHELLIFCLRVIVCCIVMGLCITVFNAYYSEYYYHTYVLTKILALTGSVGVGMLTFGILALILCDIKHFS